MFGRRYWVWLTHGKWLLEVLLEDIPSIMQLTKNSGYFQHLFPKSLFSVLIYLHAVMRYQNSVTLFPFSKSLEWSIPSFLQILRLQNFMNYPNHKLLPLFAGCWCWFSTSRRKFGPTVYTSSNSAIETSTFISTSRSKLWRCCHRSFSSINPFCTCPEVFVCLQI